MWEAFILYGAHMHISIRASQILLRVVIVSRRGRICFLSEINLFLFHTLNTLHAALVRFTFYENPQRETNSNTTLYIAGIA